MISKSKGEVEGLLSEIYFPKIIVYNDRVINIGLNSTIRLFMRGEVFSLTYLP